MNSPVQQVNIAIFPSGLTSWNTGCCAKCGLRNNGVCVRVTRGSTTQDGTDAIHGCYAVLFLFSWIDTERLPGRAVITSLVSLRSVCAVSPSVIRCVLSVLRSPEHTITTNMLYVSDSAGNVSSTNRKRNLALNSVRAQQTFAAKVTVCRHVVSQQTFVSGLDHCRVLIIHRGIT